MVHLKKKKRKRPGKLFITIAFPIIAVLGSAHPSCSLGIVADIEIGSQ